MRILRSCRAATASSSVLLIGETILEPDPARGRPVDYLLDAQMMAMFGNARERTVPEFRDLLEQSGLSLRRVIPTSSSVSIVEAAPVS